MLLKSFRFVVCILCCLLFKSLSICLFCFLLISLFRSLL